MPPLSHSSVSASSCERWWNCPGSVGLNTKLPPANPTKYAAEGTAAHALCEKYLYNKVHYKWKWDATYEIGETYEADDFKFKVTEEMAAAANLYVDTINRGSNFLPLLNDSSCWAFLFIDLHFILHFLPCY